MGARGPAAKDKPTVAYRDGVPAAPSWLSKDGAAEYARVVSEMQEAGVSPQQVDFACLMAYAAAFADYIRLRGECAEKGETMVCVSSGREMLAPRVMLRDRAQRSMLMAAQQLGFTPASRSRIPKSGATGKSDNPLAAFIGSKK